MKSYKVEIQQLVTYVLDVQGQDEEQARDKALQQWGEIVEDGREHYYQTGDVAETEEVSHIYDVTGTDDDIFLQKDLEEIKTLEQGLSKEKEWNNK
jgi:hypothetical protein